MTIHKEASMSEEEKGFTVKDRRMFSEEGQRAESRPEEPDKGGDNKAPRDAAAAGKPDAAAFEEPQEHPLLPEVNFPTFVLSLNASALVHLGAIEDPNTGTKVKNLAMAKQTIDILSLLQEKTRGNLTGDEDNILKNILYELRMMYVKETG
jgi:hypothetical protein